ncbi:hypothetical protein AYO21_04222 [Fonsecaea monophora]|uniref:Transcription factor domain-containing protein n=1 Tax=Fonsecaea monophora TaxID=254056 RepID=A0A177FD27_9EURO|nr:hypothetical protein AYO21_04222 [Fonsecaea monophora]OAG41520.1 hypothetical protein AYO21_04222 [Fonsecaea monophora]
MTDQKKDKDTFHFVAFQDPSKAAGQKSLEKSRARAHAARVTHSRRKAKRGHTVVKWIVESSGTHENNTSKSKQDKVQITDFKINPLSYLSQDKVDPFESNPHTALPRYLQSILDYAYECIHPKIITNASASDVSAVKISWRRIGQEWPLMFHLQVASAANLVRAGADNEPFPHNVEVLRLKHQARGLALVTKELQNLKGPASDSLIMAMIMVGNLTDPNPAQFPATYRLSPLATAQNLHLYARLTVIPSMIQALMELVIKRGGIQAMQQYGLVQLLQFADLMVSTKLGMPPSFPWMFPTPSILMGPKYQPDHKAAMMSMVIGTGFAQLDQIDMDLAIALRTAGEITVALDHYRERRPNAPDLTDIVNAANATHHKLLSLRPRITLDPQQTDYLWNLCRVSGLIYSDLVLFPLPPTTGVKPRLAGELRLAIDNFEIFRAEETAYIDQRIETEGYICLVLWALTLGSLAALNTPHRRYFVQKMQEYIVRWPYIISWDAYTSLMATHLWWDYIFADPVAELWNEITLFLTDMAHQSQRSVFTQSTPDRSPSTTDVMTILPLQQKNATDFQHMAGHGIPTSSSGG